MTMIILRRIGTGLIVMLLIAVVTFALFFIAPHDVATAVAGNQASPETIALVRERLGLDRPVVVQFFDYLWRLLRGDLGYSYYNSMPVSELIWSRMNVTASLALGAAVLNVILGVPLGVVSATRPNSLTDRVISGSALVLHSVPGFLLGIVLLYVFFFLFRKVGIDIFPGSGYIPFTADPLGWARSLTLPWLAVSLSGAATFIRLMRSGMLDVLNDDYVRTARATGAPRRRIIWLHAARSSASAVLTHLGMVVANLLGGVILIEQIFGLPGVGRLAFQAVNDQDLPVLMGTIMLSTAFLVVSSIVVDLLYPVLDPKQRTRSASVHRR